MTRAEEHPPLEILSAHVDGEIAAAEVPALEEHLSRCNECRKQMDDLRVLAAATADQEAPPVPAGLVARIAARLDEEPGVSAPSPTTATSRRRHLPPWLWRGGPLAAAASFLGAAILWRIWLAGPAPVEPLKTMAPAVPAMEQVLPPEEGRGAGKSEAVPMDKLKVKGLADADEVQPPAAPPPAAPQPMEKKERQEAAREQSVRQDAASPEAVQAFAFEEENAPAPILLQMEENGTRVRLARDGDLLVEAPGYRCRIRIDMEGVVMPTPANEAASRDLLLRLVRERYRAELEKECGPLPEELAAPPLN